MAANMAVGNRSGSAVWGMVAIMLVLLCGGCSKLPEPEPIWKAAVGTSGCAGGEGAVACLNSEQRVRNYLAALLPASPDGFAESLEKIGAMCSIDKGMWNCSYTKAQAPEPCVVALRANISIWYDRNVPEIEANMLRIKSLVVPDPETDDMRGCFFY